VERAAQKTRIITAANTALRIGIGGQCFSHAVTKEVE
jgi:hypothetical protein